MTEIKYLNLTSNIAYTDESQDVTAGEESILMESINADRSGRFRIKNSEL